MFNFIYWIMKKKDLVVVKCCRKVSYIKSYSVRVHFKNQDGFHDIMSYFDKSKADCYLANILSRNKMVDVAFVIENQIFL